MRRRAPWRSTPRPSPSCPPERLSARVSRRTGSRQGPRIALLSPGHDAVYRTGEPMVLHAEFLSAADGAAPDMETLQVKVRKGWFGKDITDKVEPYVEGAAVRVPEVDFSGYTGDFRFEIHIRDERRRPACRAPGSATPRSPPPTPAPSEASDRSPSPCACSRSHAPSSRPPTASRSANPILRATRTTSTNRPLKSSRCRRRNPQSMRWLGRFPAPSTRNATSSSSLPAIPRDENTPSHTRTTAPSPSSGARTAHCADRRPHTARKTPSGPVRPPGRSRDEPSDPPEATLACPARRSSWSGS